MGQEEPWQATGDQSELYETHRVPPLFEPMARRLLRNVLLREGQRVLDVACGTGIVARLAAPLVGQTGRVAGLDLSEAMLAVARVRDAEARLRIEWHQGDATALPFANATFHAILCQQGLQFFGDRLGALREMRRVLMPRGTVALNVFGAPSRYHLALAQALTTRAGSDAARRVFAAFALGESEALRAMLYDAGFRSVEIWTEELTRFVLPSQEWLLQDTASTRYGSGIAALDGAERAEMIREIATVLKDLWHTDRFVVPYEVHFAYMQD